MKYFGLFIAALYIRIINEQLLERAVMNDFNMHSEQEWRGSSVLQNFSTNTRNQTWDMENLSIPRIIAIGGGKGGVGKTVTSILLGIALANRNKSTIIVDADLAGANLHGYFRQLDPDMTINYFLTRQTKDLNDVVQQTEIPNLKVITGMPGHLRSIQMKYWEKQKLLRHLSKLRADYVILDLGPGTSYNNIDFFLKADDSIIISTDDPISLYDSYGYIRVAIFRKLGRIFKYWPDFIQKLKGCGELARGSELKTIRSFLNEDRQIPESWRLLVLNTLHSFRPKMILNMVRENDLHQGLQAIRLKSKEILDVGIDNWGDIHYDIQLKRVLQREGALSFLQSESIALNDMARIVKEWVVNSEKNAENLQHKGWLNVESNERPLVTKSHIQICNYRCLAWNSCDERNGGLPCPKLEPAPLTMPIAS